MILPGLLAMAAWGQARPPGQPAPAQHNHGLPGMNPGPAARENGRLSAAQQAQAEAMHAMEPGATMDMAHMRMTTMREASAQDRERADKVLATLRAVIEPYKDYRVALAEGYQIFLPDMPQHEYHFNNYWNGFVESFTFDATRPTSLLYKKTRAGGWELTGAMYTAPRSATPEQIDARVPLSVARWHQHINMCMPRRGVVARPNWRLFGLEGSITTEEACREAGGRFYPQIFGWMVHIYPFATPDKIFAH